MGFTIEYSKDALDHLRTLVARQQRIVLDAVDGQLKNEPTRQTRNRKPMRPNPVAGRELRVGDLRVYYDVLLDERIVVINAVGIERGNTVRIAGEVIDL